VAVLRIPDENRSLREHDEVRDYLAEMGIDTNDGSLRQTCQRMASADQVLSAYSEQVEKLKQQGGYVHGDVIDVNAGHSRAGCDAGKNSTSKHRTMRTKCATSSRAAGCSTFIPQQGPVVAIEVEAGDLIRVPRGTLHWFDLCGDRRIRAIRLFQDKSGWTPHYTSSGVERNYEPVCWGPRYIPLQQAAK